ncbi:MAG: UbiA prenyltransferase family protein [Candidatus Helarchaeota archaeon]
MTEISERDGSKLKVIIKLMRPQQMYKNAFVFIGALFAVKLFQFLNFFIILIAFFLLCAISAGNYVLNDILDLEKDKVHEEKKNRPLPSGLISKRLAIIICISLLSSGIFGSIAFGFYIHFIFLSLGMVSLLPYYFGLYASFVFITGFSYNIKLKSIAFVDVLVLSANFVWRALAGCMILNITVSHWLILGVFLLALFLSLCKRKGDLELLKEKAELHKKSYQSYTSNLLEHLITISATSIIITYILYSVSSDTAFKVSNSPLPLIITVPFLLFFIMRYMHFVFSEDEKSRNFDKVLFDKQIVINFLIWFIVLAILLYWNEILVIIFSQ